MKIKVRYLGVFVKLSGRDEEYLFLDEGETAAALKRLLFKRYGRRFVEHFNEFSYRNAILMRNGVVLDDDDVLESDDEVIVAHPVGGG